MDTFRFMKRELALALAKTWIERLDGPVDVENEAPRILKSSRDMVEKMFPEDGPEIRPVGECWCGCGESTGSYFVRGHDASAKDWVIAREYQRGDTSQTASFLAAHGYGPRRPTWTTDEDATMALEVDMSYAEIHRSLKDMGFEPTGPHERRNWWRCIVVAMVRSPGTVPEIEAKAVDVARVLGLDISSRRSGNPCFHLGLEGVRTYFRDKLVGEPRVGNKSFDELEPYCIYHPGPWVQLIDGGCDPYCKYGLHIRGG